MHVATWIISSSFLSHLGTTSAFVLHRPQGLDRPIHHESILERNAHRPGTDDNEKIHHGLHIDQALSTSCPHTNIVTTRSALLSGVAATIVAVAVSAPSTSLALPFPASTTTIASTESIELSKGAFVIQTASESLLKSTIDSKSLLKALFIDRKELSESVGRIQTAVSSELQNPAWKNILRELVEVEGDLAGSVQLYPPQDIKVALQDLSSGKLNLLVNGEIVNVVIDESFGKDEDEIKVTIKGFKQGQVARTVPTFSEPRYGPIRTYFSRYEGFLSWWETPYPDQVSSTRRLGREVESSCCSSIAISPLHTNKYLLPGMAATNGEILLTGAAGTIWLIYVSAYGFYQYEREQEILASREKKAKLDAATVVKKIKPIASVGKKETVDKALTEEKSIQEGETQQEGQEQLPNVVEKKESIKTKLGRSDGQASPKYARTAESKQLKTGLRRFFFFWRARKDD